MTPRWWTETDDEARSLLYRLLGLGTVRNPFGEWTLPQWGVFCVAFPVFEVVLFLYRPSNAIVWLVLAALTVLPAVAVAGPVASHLGLSTDTGVGYHTRTLAAEARGHRPQPPTRTVRRILRPATFHPQEKP